MIIKRINQGVSAINKVVLVIAGILLVGTVIACALQVLTRHIPSFKVLGMEELARMQFVWLIALGMALAISNGSHMRVDIIVSKIPQKLKKYYDVFLQLVVLIFCIVLLIEGMIKINAVMGQVTPIWQAPYPILYASLVVGAILCIINVLNNVLILISGKEIGEEQITDLDGQSVKEGK